MFDLETGLFRVDNEYTMQIRLSGHGQRYAMVRKALQRNGILANRNVESETYIETGDLKGGGALSCIVPVKNRYVSPASRIYWRSSTKSHLSKKVSGTNPTGSIPLSELISYGEE